ncbi:AMP-dependent synthetase/ligase [Cordyceps fumosorosea ARSEF 2679]|uniref:Very long-chain fatty acid transport protein n=1 Tax=Cordyceps fumosorosea (strain ARSEF 2679) TaxID=1081104 RepID=A0A168ED49_CORFA|nr:AMP-dependent synthetase/ligase [Cordyceps fumosorosea ARSEF 2679]OAA73670.1 AMP-dependent synthetase/ligase [Cordyceps fumosorosea ARSEF 2679]
MPVPLAVAVPAALAGAAYLNAKSGLWYDLKMQRVYLTTMFRLLRGLRRDRLSLFYTLEDWALSKTHAGRDVLRFEDRRYTYAQLYDHVLRHGTYLRARHGVKPGDIVALDFQNSDTFLFLWWGLWAIGAKPAMINYNLTGKPLAHCVGAATARLCIVDPAVEGNVTDEVRAQLPGVEFMVWTPEREAAEAAAIAPVRFPDADRSEAEYSNMALLIYTSGTTGLPKAAIVSWAKCIAGGTMASMLLGRGDGRDVMYTSMPLYHSSAAILSFCATVVSGSTQALGRRFSTKTFWQDVRQHDATGIQYVGETLRYLLAAPPQRDPATGADLDKQHKVTAAIGNGLRPDIWNAFKDRFGIATIAEFYASTEGAASTWNLSSNDLFAGAVGRLGWLRRLLLRNDFAFLAYDHELDRPLRDPTTGFCRRVPAGAPGELVTRLDPADLGRLFQGYFGDARASESKVLRGVFVEGDAWLRTGDIMSLDAEGRYAFNDRVGDTFRWKSENVSTNEVAHAVGTYPPVREANVYGVRLPHHDGRAGCVAVNFAGASPPDADTLRGLAAHVREGLPRYAVPLFLRVVRDIGGAQTTGTNKQQKSVLRNAGVKPGALDDGAALYWLRGDTYVPFGKKEWRELEGGRVKL